LVEVNRSNRLGRERRAVDEGGAAVVSGFEICAEPGDTGGRQRNGRGRIRIGYEGERAAIKADVACFAGEELVQPAGSV